MQAMSILANRSKTSKSAKASKLPKHFHSKIGIHPRIVKFGRSINEHRYNQNFQRPMVIH